MIWEKWRRWGLYWPFLYKFELLTYQIPPDRARWIHSVCWRLCLTQCKLTIPHIFIFEYSSKIARLPILLRRDRSNLQKKDSMLHWKKNCFFQTSKIIWATIGTQEKMLKLLTIWKTCFSQIAITMYVDLMRNSPILVHKFSRKKYGILHERFSCTFLHCFKGILPVFLLWLSRRGKETIDTHS